jgi:Mce-associated membrane protein
MSTGQTAGTPSWRVPLNVALYLLTVVGLCAVVLLVVLLVRGDNSWFGDKVDDDISISADDVEKDASGADLHHAVLEAASAEAAAFINIDYQDMDTSIQTVRDHATGEFAKQYDKSLESLRTLMTRNKSVMEGQVLAAGVVNADQDSARVLVATKGTVQNTSTGGKQSERNLRLQIDLEYVDGAWLTSDLQFVG